MKRGKIKVLNPLGIPKKVRPVQPAVRNQNLDGKKVYLVDVKYPSTKVFFEELFKYLSARYPQIQWVLEEKKGTYFEDDPELWQKIKREGAGAVIGIGH